MPLDPSPAPLTAADAATELTWLARLFAAGFTTLGAASAGADAGPAHRLASAAASRVVGVHAQAIAELVPESVLLADARAAGASRPVELPSDPVDVLDELAATLDAVSGRATWVADAALVRLAGHARADLAAARAALTAA